LLLTNHLAILARHFRHKRKDAQIMRIHSLALNGLRGWPDLDLQAIATGVNVIVGPKASGKTTIAEFLAQVLFGKLPAQLVRDSSVPEGEATVEGAIGRLRLRRYADGTRHGRLTVASLDGQPVDRESVQRMLGGLSPEILSRMQALGFGSPSSVDRHTAARFARDFQILNGAAAPNADRRVSELAARRDALASELEARIAAERQLSKELEERRRELDRRVREGEGRCVELELRLRAVESTLAETDARLRYRRLELNAALRWSASEPEDFGPHIEELDEQIRRWRQALADLAQREATLRSRMPQPDCAGNVTFLADQQSWLAVSRQLAADLDGEVARLARAAASQQCICRDAHPRLRPIVETLSRQMDSLAAMIGAQQLASEAERWSDEVEQLQRSQDELRKQLELLMARRAYVAAKATGSQRLVDAAVFPGPDHSETAGPGDGRRAFSAADAAQLEQRRLELEQERFELAEKVREAQSAVRRWRSQRGDIDRQRAGVLSARSIEHVQRELADVQKKLEAAAQHGIARDGNRDDGPLRASDYLAQLSAGRLVQLELGGTEEGAWAVRETGERLGIETLSAADSDLVRLSFALALLTAASRRGIRLPFILDEPFAHLDATSTAGLAAVLDSLTRSEGHQILVFTERTTAVERFASLGAAVHDLVALRQWPRELEKAIAVEGLPAEEVSTQVIRQAKKSSKARVGRAAKRTRRRVATDDRNAA
jgi:DNA repair exonuclease SbcCD ATPase subunit